MSADSIGPTWRTVSALVATGLLAACGESAIPPPDRSTPQPDITLAGGRVVTDVRLEYDESDRSIFVWYRTTTSSSDCRQLQAEVRDVWSRVLRAEADKRGAGRVTVLPEDPSLRSQSFAHVRDEQLQWREDRFGRCAD
jgi:hypothetical protein